jgi:NADH pyrophosphatase NudC (nudix superfamily)
VAGDFKLDPREVADARWVGVDEVLGLERTFERDREFFKSVLPLL